MRTKTLHIVVIMFMFFSMFSGILIPVDNVKAPSYLYETIEDGVLPGNYSTAGGMLYDIDSNSSIGGVHCINFSAPDSVVGVPRGIVYWDDWICPDIFTFKVLFTSIEENGDISILNSVFDTIVAYIQFLDNGSIRIWDNAFGESTHYDYFTSFGSWEYNTVYTFTLSGIDYDNFVFDYVSLENSTTSQILSDVNWYPNNYDAALYSTSRLSGLRISTSPGNGKGVTAFFDDWTSGTNIDMTTGDSSDETSYSTILDGTIINDGSPAQNSDEYDNQITFLYDTVNHSVVNTYYFDEHDSSNAWYSYPQNITEGTTNIYGYTAKMYNYETIESGVLPTNYSVANGMLYDIDSNSSIGGVHCINFSAPDSVVGAPKGIVYWDDWAKPDIFTFKSMFTNIEDDCVIGILNSVFDTYIAYFEFLDNGSIRIWDNAFGESTHYDYFTSFGSWEYNTVYTFTLSGIDYDNFVFDYVSLENSTTSQILSDVNWYPNNYDAALYDYSRIAGLQFSTGNGDGVTAFLDNYTSDVGDWHTDVLRLPDNTANGTSSHADWNISNVELRVHGYIPEDDYDNVTLFIQPVYDNVTLGNTYELTLLSYDAGESYSSSDYQTDWLDVTTDVYAPGVWTWDDVMNLSCNLRAVLSGNSDDIVYVGQVDMRVTIVNGSYANSIVAGAGYTTSEIFTKNITGLNEGQLYYYRAYGNTSYTNATSFNNGTEEHFLTRPADPNNHTVVIVNDSAINISWDKGDGANTTLLVKKTTGMPSSPSDGTILYNGTGSFYVVNNIEAGDVAYYRLWSYGNWSDPDLYWFSLGSEDILWGSLILNCYNESDGIAITNYDVFVSNESGSEVYTAEGVNNYHAINVSDCPHGLVSVIFSHDDFSSRTYFITLLENAWYFLNGFLSNATSDYVYYLTVNDQYDEPIEDALVEIKRYVNFSENATEFENISIQYTGADGEVVTHLIPDALYKVRINKSGYEDTIEDFRPSDSIYTKTFRLNIEEVEFVNETVVPLFWGDINGSGILFVNYSDVELETLNTQVYVYNTSTNDLVYYDSRVNENSFSFNTSGNITVGCYRVELFYNHSTFGAKKDYFYTCYNRSYISITNESHVESIFDAVFIYNPFGWSNTFAFIILIFGLFSFGQRNSGVTLILVGGILLFVNVVVGLNLINVSIPVIFIVLGILVQWRNQAKEEGVG